ncbi:hypothetical protein T484DRAFT_3351790 [Baffinella frigidus]|nr:hypothetical protein T484DRAFT_3351790 [Cryptophyta sp. CCMP2293]
MAVDAGRPRSAGEDRMIQEGVLRAGSGVQGYDSSRGAELASVSESGQLADEEFGRRGSVQQMQEAGRRDSNIQVLFPEGTALLPLSLDGFPCEEKLTLARILPAPQRGKLLEGRTRSLAWTTKTMKAICEAKLLQDAVDSCAGLPRSRFPLFVGRWVGLHFGQSTFGEQQMVDLIESLETQRGKSFLMHALHLCCSEQLNAGQTAALLHILDIIDVTPPPYPLNPKPQTPNLDIRNLKPSDALDRKPESLNR